MVGVGSLVGVPLRPHREAVDTEVEIGTGGALDADDCGDVALAVVAVVQAPSGAICWSHEGGVNVDFCFGAEIRRNVAS